MGDCEKNGYVPDVTNDPALDYALNLPPEGLTELEAFIHWPKVWMRAIGQAWANKDFRDALLDENTTNHTLEKAAKCWGFKDFVIPESMSVRVVEVTVEDIEKADDGSPFLKQHPLGKVVRAAAKKHHAKEHTASVNHHVATAGGAAPENDTLVLVVPLPPAPKDEKHWPIALAAYDAAGRSYPFTCCW